MKFVFALMLLGLSTASANTVRIGNGGDTIRVNSPGMIAILMTAPHKLRLITHAWINSGKSSIILPKDKYREFEQVIINTPLEIQESPCLVEGQGKTAAAYTTPYRSICVSTKRLVKTAGRELPELQVLALMGHEYLHLLGYGEADAIEFQREIVNYIAQFGIPTLNRLALEPIDKTILDSFKSVNWENKNDVADFAQNLQSYLKRSLDPLLEQQDRYPMLTSDQNIIPDILLRVSYLNLMTAANWGTGPDILGLQTLLATQYFTISTNGEKAPITSSHASRLFRSSIEYPLIYPNWAIPYIHPVTGKDAYESILADTAKLIDDLNTSISKMDLPATTINFLRK